VEGVLSTWQVDSYGIVYTKHCVGGYSVDPDTIEVVDDGQLG
jgi:hypothetical protein